MPCSFISLNILCTLSFYRLQRLDEDEYGGHQALVMEGMPPSLSLFMARPSFPIPEQSSNIWLHIGRRDAKHTTDISGIGACKRRVQKPCCASWHALPVVSFLDFQ